MLERLPTFARTWLADGKLVLLAAYLALDHAAIGDRITSLGLSPQLGAWAVLYALLAAALAAAAYIPQALPRVVVAAILAAGSVALHSYEWTTVSPLDYASFETMLASRGDAGSAMAQHGGVLLKAVGAALVLFAALALPPRGRTLPPGLAWAMPCAALIGLSGLLYARGGEGSRALPAAFTPVAYSAIKGALLLTDENAPREQVAVSPSGSAPTRDIVLIVDESIAANYLDINHPRGVYSGLAEERPGFAIFNYGIAASVTNCSAGSNKSLRFGGRRANFREVGRRSPSIWAFAMNAGYRTVYLDGQRMGGELQNLKTADERAEIDDFVQLDADVAVVDRDHELARLLAERIGNGIPEFIYVNKVGAHFPVADKFPLEAAKFLPIPERGRTAGIIDMGPVHGRHRGTAEEWRLYRNAYRNTLIWNVGGFFDRLLPSIDPADAVIIYTADHGQDLHERGNPGKGTHCTNDPLPEEGAVPLVVIDDAAAPGLAWDAHHAGLRDAASHFRIFPTLLELMTYPLPEMAATYGPSLNSAGPDRLAFTPDYFAMLGREPSWRTFERTSLAEPPAADRASMAAAGEAPERR